MLAAAMAMADRVLSAMMNAVEGVAAIAAAEKFSFLAMG